MKVLAIASAGGHWIQLLRLMPAFEQHEIIFASTRQSFSETVSSYKFYAVPDANRWNKFKLIYMGAAISRLVLAVKPDIVVTTGAAPGLMGLLAGKLFGAKTIWVDSIANVEKLSLSGRLALLFADRTYTQWEGLATPKVHYHGNVLS
ncbi:glycosyltransferase family protein [Pontibacter oryzae]|uniref:Oligosaccharide biosynthesis protein Alg14 n=1 Tax=Pontibacter oryzae TaxID=2304593 RepID=A0A399SFZ9_9BACT|nr:oligosaccharide biosynthesis protein Alg14 [Pontibacter oryzae]RIJ42061.1 oligosaccharide biosynthesis protein Alg14 [Pontibacter oryzae]